MHLTKLLYSLRLLAMLACLVLKFFVTSAARRRLCGIFHFCF